MKNIQSGWTSLPLATANKNNDSTHESTIPILHDPDVVSVADDSAAHYTFDDHFREPQLTWYLILKSLPWYVPRNYEIVLKTGEVRVYDLGLHQRWFIMLTDSSSW
jgi:hypothetical protein